MLKEFRAWMSQMKANGERLAMDKTGTTDLTTIATGLIILGVVGAVGIYIMNEVYQIAVITSGSQFYTASTKIIDIINTGFGLLVKFFSGYNVSPGLFTHDDILNYTNFSKDKDAAKAISSKNSRASLKSQSNYSESFITMPRVLHDTI
jgi:hypothetical protein